MNKNKIKNNIILSTNTLALQTSHIIIMINQVAIACDSVLDILFSHLDNKTPIS